ncbi:response regulator [Sphingomicrobium nitratireducens]|uniref:response regulator n=1 Tax=Sphingomicrobium nitratireducens TaxID=2964666 RepID=UPI0022407D5C
MLVVEDEPLTAFDNESRLESAGYEVVGTRDNFSDALADLEKNEVDLVLADIRLSGERTGIDLAREAKARGVPVLFCTGMPPEECSSLAVGSLVKPYTDRQLMAALKAVDLLLQGEEPKKLPKGMTLYAPSAA